MMMMKLLSAQGVLISEDATVVSKTLTQSGIPHGKWDATLFTQVDYDTLLGNPNLQEAVLETVAQPLATLKATFGYLTEDIIGLTPETPNLGGILTQFRAEHHHTDDEVRVILHGEGIFGIIPSAGKGDPFEVSLTQGDWIVIPENTRHYFYLTCANTVIALRVFKNNPQWEAIYEPLPSA
jgi:1,2-dihydroxy-3-keto-5-methylthiopentene dioxygenase